jgi:general secretion pathway protein L
MSDGVLKAEGDAEQLAELQAQASGQVVVLIASEMVHISTVTIPGRNTRQRLKAAPFVLEEQLASDLDDMHFAFKTEAESDDILVLAIDKSAFDEVLQQLASWAIEADVILPISALLDSPKDTVSVWQLEQEYLINDGTSRWQANEGLARMQLKLLQNEDLPGALLFWSEHEAPGWLTEMAFEIHHEVVTKPWQALISRLDNRPPNLLSGPYARRIDILESVQQWKRPLQFAAAIVVAQFLFMLVEYIYLGQQRDALREEITTLYHEVAPGARVVDARRQMQQLISQRQGAQLSDDSFPLMVQGLAGAISSARGIETTNINFSQQTAELRVDLLASNLSQFDGLKQSLEAAGYEVTMGGATAQGNQYSGRLIMRSR